MFSTALTRHISLFRRLIRTHYLVKHIWGHIILRLIYIVRSSNYFSLWIYEPRVVAVTQFTGFLSAFESCIVFDFVRFDIRVEIAARSGHLFL